METEVNTIVDNMDTVPYYFLMSTETGNQSRHAIGIGLFKNFCFYINRGDSSIGHSGFSLLVFEERKYSSMLLSAHSKSNHTPLVKVEDLLKKKTCHEFFQKGKSQAAGNCVWSSYKGLYLAAVFFNAFKALQDKNISYKDSIHIAKELAFAAYKGFTTHARAQMIQDYLDFDSPVAKEKTLVQNVFLKANKASWKNRGMGQMLSSFDAYKKSFAIPVNPLPEVLCEKDIARVSNQEKFL